MTTTEPQWRLTRPGVLSWGGTGFDVRYVDVATYQVFHNGRSPSWTGAYRTLPDAQKAAHRMASEMIAMGLDP